ncbi:hypothetical protein DFH07DRAFT_848305 [Mycena maculata]|uniref:Uncharacterized protein n=1 Tax=Mycena maculata TaxID=230809 RepID=A0AAD7HXV6_9AGAR|nr:hypothetical protein DFH07DRAFT_848305 [Mycena maculata]
MHLNLFPHSVLKVTPLLQFWLPRAGNLPLSLSLVYKGDNAFNYSTVVEMAGLDALLVLIRNYARHWSSIALHIWLPALLRLESPLDSFASLRRLTLDCGVGFEGNQSRRLSAFSNAPTLRELHIIGGVSAAQIDLPYPQIEVLRLDNSTPEHCMLALALAPNIKHLTSTLWSFDGVGALRMPTQLSLLRLESLSAVLSYTRGPALLDRLTLPTLEHLTLDLQGPEQITLLTSFVLRSSCFLRRLSVKFGPLRDAAGAFTQLFTALDSLEALDVRKAGPALDIAFGLLRAQPHLLPNLASLHVERTHASREEEDAELLADLLEARWNVPDEVTLPVRLRQFRLHSPLTTPPEYRSPAVRRLGRLRAQGMVVEITSAQRSWFYV